MEDVFGNGEEWCPLLGHTVSGDTVLKQQAPHSLEHPPPLTVYTHRQHQVLYKFLSTSLNLAFLSMFSKKLTSLEFSRLSPLPKYTFFTEYF